MARPTFAQGGYGSKWQKYRDCLVNAYVKIGNTIELLYEKREEVA